MLNLYQTLAVAVLALWTGELLKKRVRALERFCIPSPVIGGLLFAVISLVVHLTCDVDIQFDDTLKEVCMVFFFTSVGFQANIKMVRQGGRPLVVLIGLVALAVVVQNLAAVGIAMAIGLDGMMGMTAGSIPMVGGHGTAGAFGPLLERMGVAGATTLTTAAATFGIVAGSLMGGPVGERLIERYRLMSGSEGNEAEVVEVGKQSAGSQRLHTSYTIAVFQLIAAIGIGTLVSKALSLTGLTFPIYIGSMIVAAVIRNYGEHTNRLTIPMHQINDLGDISLSLFLGMAMVTLRLWELSDLALPLILLLTAQTVIMFVFAQFVCFRAMGKDYDAAVMTAGFCGFGMGATPNAMANMQAICEKYRHSVKAFLLIPIVGSMFADFVNSIIITCFINAL